MPNLNLSDLMDKRPPDSALLIQLGKEVFEVLEASQYKISVRMAKGFKLDSGGAVMEVPFPVVTNYWFLKYEQTSSDL